jgi:transglutaminase-like putative cysteine protease
MKYQLGCELNYNITSSSTFIFNIGAVTNDYQKILAESLQTEPLLDYREYIAPESNNRYLRITPSEGKFSISYRATVESTYSSVEPSSIIEIPPEQLPMETLYYLYPSRYCQSDLLMRLAQDEFGELEPGYSRVQAICNWIYDKVTYLSGSTDASTSAYDIATQRAGVCRDFAHLGIAFCRALNIPARFVSAYAYQLDPPDFHACFEAFLGNNWYLFDATRLAPVEGLVRIGTGKDAADVSFATVFGAVEMEGMNVYINSLENQFLKTSQKAIASN